VNISFINLFLNVCFYRNKKLGMLLKGVGKQDLEEYLGYDLLAILYKAKQVHKVN
jgi:hypothetical protein